MIQQPTPGYISKDLKHRCCKQMFRIIHHGQEVEITQMPTNAGRDKMVCTYNAIYCSASEGKEILSRTSA